jgi:hypothetical protein
MSVRRAQAQRARANNQMDASYENTAGKERACHEEINSSSEERDDAA